MRSAHVNRPAGDRGGGRRRPPDRCLLRSLGACGLLRLLLRLRLYPQLTLRLRLDSLRSIVAGGTTATGARVRPETATARLFGRGRITPVGAQGAGRCKRNVHTTSPSNVVRHVPALLLHRILLADVVRGAVGPRATHRRRVPFAMGGHDGSR